MEEVVPMLYFLWVEPQELSAREEQVEEPLSERRRRMVEIEMPMKAQNYVVKCATQRPASVVEAKHAKPVVTVEKQLRSEPAASDCAASGPTAIAAEATTDEKWGQKLRTAIRI